MLKKSPFNRPRKESGSYKLMKLKPGKDAPMGLDSNGNVIRRHGKS